MEVKSTRIQNLDEKGWKNYFYLGRNVTLENTHPDEWMNFKKDRLDQYENAPDGYQLKSVC